MIEIEKAKRELLELSAMSDRVWAALRGKEAAINRIAESGARPEDDEFVRVVFHVVAGDLERLAFELAIAEAGG